MLKYLFVINDTKKLTPQTLLLSNHLNVFHLNQDTMKWFHSTRFSRGHATVPEHNHEKTLRLPFEPSSTSIHSTQSKSFNHRGLLNERTVKRSHVSWYGLFHKYEKEIRMKKKFKCYLEPFFAREKHER